MGLLKEKPQTVMGYTIAEPKPTIKALFLVFIYISAPVFIVGSLIDAVVQLLFGVCIGLWCFV